MDKILRNVIIFSSVILILAIGLVVYMFNSNNTSSNIDNRNAQAAINSANINAGAASTANGEVQHVKLSVSGGTYILTPSVLKKGVPVQLEADLASMKGCSRSVVISEFNVRKYVQPGDNIIEFTPTKTGTIRIACSMNMYTGSFTVE